MAERVSRNDPCPCGSGVKYKKCHEGRDAAKPGRTGTLTMVLLAVLIIGGATAVVIGFARGGGDASRSGGRPGQVWSPEHGHWHDAPVPGRAPINATGLGEQKPAPPGTPPPGKVWSTEHGHWHDAPRPLPPGLVVTAAPAPPPPQPNP